MKRSLLIFMLLIAMSMTGVVPATAERLVTSLSTHQVMISSNFTGTELVLFGSVERDAATVPRRGGYDIIVTVIGPREGMVTRRKGRVLGIWTNVESVTFDRAPAYLAVLSNRPLDAIMSPDIARRTEVGLRNFPLVQANESQPPEAFKDVHRGRFARAVRAEEGQDLPPPHLEIDARDGLMAVIALDQAADADHRLRMGR